MQRRHRATPVLAVVVGLAAVVLLTLTGCSTSSPAAGSTQPTTESDQGGETDAGAEAEGEAGQTEAEREANGAAERIDAWHQAKEAGTLRVQAAAAAPAVGWSGEQAISPTADDWEPAIAADPNSAFVYLLTTRYSPPAACRNKCPLPYIMLKVSSDGGATWGPDRYICTCSGVGSQADPIIEVVPNTGAVYSVFMNGFNVMFTKSTDHGATWSTPVKTYGNVAWNDKPILATSDNGQDIYVSWNGPTSGDPWVAQSHNGGTTWTQTKIVDSPRYFFAFDGDVLPNGTVVFSEASLDYSGPHSTLVGQSQDQRAALDEQRRVVHVEPGRHRRARARLHGGRVSGGLLPGPHGDQRGWEREPRPALRRSNDLPWQRNRLVTPIDRRWGHLVRAAGTIDLGRDGRLPGRRVTRERRRARLVHADERRQLRCLERLVPTSTDGGTTWAAPVKISDVTAGATYKTANGFLDPSATTARSRSRTPARRSRPGAKATPTQAPAGPGSTARLAARIGGAARGRPAQP